VADTRHIRFLVVGRTAVRWTGPILAGRNASGSGMFFRVVGGSGCPAGGSLGRPRRCRFLQRPGFNNGIADLLFISQLPASGEGPCLPPLRVPLVALGGTTIFCILSRDGREGKYERRVRCPLDRSLRSDPSDRKGNPKYTRWEKSHLVAPHSYRRRRRLPSHSEYLFIGTAMFVQPDEMGRAVRGSRKTQRSFFCIAKMRIFSSEK
jgi:hypothetical protein